VFVAHFDALITGVGDSHLKHFGSIPDIFTIIMDDSVPSRANLLLVSFVQTYNREHSLCCCICIAVGKN